MKKTMQESFAELLTQWKRNQETHILEGAEDAATLLEHRFYSFIEVFGQWFKSIPKPTSLEEALSLPEIQTFVAELPPPLYLPFELELDALIDEVDQENDEKYD